MTLPAPMDAPPMSPDPVDYQIWWKLQDRVYRSQIRDVDEAGRQWRPRVRVCVRAHGGHFEHRL